MTGGRSAAVQTNRRIVPMPGFLLLLHDTTWHKGDLAPAEMQAIIARYGAWAGGLAERGMLRGGHKLADDGGRHVRRDGERVTATDGPYAEAREVVGGLFVIEAADMAEAEAVARTCPHMDLGWIEVRAIEPT
jgi:hypothetical protein